MLPQDLADFVNAQRVGRLATVDAHGRPHVVPICFAVVGNALYSVLDAKPKTVPVTSLRRVRNLLANPDVQVLLDRYDEDWSRLAYVQLRGRATLLTREGDSTEHERALGLLRRRYPQYETMDLNSAPIIKVEVESHADWGALVP